MSGWASNLGRSAVGWSKLPIWSLVLVVACGDSTADPTIEGAIEDQPRTNTDATEDARELPCTERGLRDAIATGGGPYRFACDGSQAIVLSSSVVVDSDVTLDGHGELQIDGPADGIVFVIEAGSDVELRGMTVRGGDACPGAGGIDNWGVLSLIDMSVAENQSCEVGGIWNRQLGFLTLRNSEVTNNAGDEVGGIRNDGTAMVFLSSISRNQGDVGAVENRGELFNVYDSVVSENTGATVGGFSNVGVSALLVYDTEVNENAGGEVGAIVNRKGKTALTRVTMTGNQGGDVGGIANDAATAVALVDSNVAENEGAVTGLDNRGSGEITLYGTVMLDECDGTITSNGANRMVFDERCGFDEEMGDELAF